MENCADAGMLSAQPAARTPAAAERFPSKRDTMVQLTSDIADPATTQGVTAGPQRRTDGAGFRGLSSLASCIAARAMAAS